MLSQRFHQELIDLRQTLLVTQRLRNISPQRDQFQLIL